MTTGILHILPSAAAVEAFNRRRAAESGVLLGTPALTLKRLAEAVFRGSGDPRTPLSTVGRRLLLEELATHRCIEGENYFAPLREFPGFVHTLDTLFAELKQSLVPPGDFSGAVRRIGANARLSGIAALYGAYAGALARKGLIDHHDLELLALEHLKKGGGLPPVFDGISRVACRSIYELTPLQLALLAEVARRLPVELELPWNPEHPSLYAYVSRTADALEALDNSDLNLEPVYAEPAGPFLSPLLPALFTDDPAVGARIAPPSGMALFAAPGPYRECEEIGRRVRALLEGGTDPLHIAAVFRNLELYGPMMEDVCRRYRIPVSYRRGAPLAHSPLVRACLAPLDLVQARFGREELLGLITSSYLDTGRFGVSPDTIEEVLVASGYLDETLGSVENSIRKRIALRTGEGKGTGREQAVLRGLRPLLRELRLFAGERTLGEFTPLLERFIERHLIYRRAIETVDNRTLKRDASAITLFRQVLVDLEREMGSLGLADRRFSPAGFAALLRQGMEGVYLAGERGAGLTILNFHDVRGLRFRHLFMGGLNEGVCPVRHDGHPLFKDGDKLLLHRATGSRPFRTAREKGEEEPLLFFLAIGCATEGLTLSGSYVDGRGGAMLRSPFLEELLMAVDLEEARLPVSGMPPSPESCLEREEMLNALAVGGRFSLPPGLAGPFAGSLARIAGNAAMEAGRERFFRAEEKPGRAALSTPYTGTLRRADILAELRAFYESPEGNRFAPTTLEEFGSCPFRYFLRRLLRLLPLDKPEMELAPKDEGALAHEILRNIYTRLRDEGMFPLRDAATARTIVREEAGTVFARWEAERVTVEPLLWEIGKEKMLALLERVVEDEAEEGGPFVPTLFEHPFADLEVADDDGSRVFLTGAIDRVDRGEGEKIRVVDYKLGGSRTTYNAYLKKEQLGTTSFQMPVYLLAAARAVAGETGGVSERFTARYWLLRRGEVSETDFAGGKEDFTRFFSTDPDMRRALGDDNFLNRLCKTVRAMKTGDFQTTPKGCQFCDFGSVCRFVEVGVREE